VRIEIGDDVRAQHRLLTERFGIERHLAREDAAAAVANFSSSILKQDEPVYGISAEVLPTIFEPFTQASQTLDRAQGGLGIGLTLVRKLVEMHGGTVEGFSDGVGKGSEFVVRLPVLTETLQAVQQATEAGKDRAAVAPLVGLLPSDSPARWLTALRTQPVAAVR
jgi:signal transduction histidine kinase